MTAAVCGTTPVVAVALITWALVGALLALFATWFAWLFIRAWWLHRHGRKAQP